MNASRRDLLRFASLAPFAAAAAQAQPPGQKSMIGVPFDKKPLVRMGFIGVGGRGRSQLQNFTAVDGVSVTALCDISKESIDRSAKMLDKAGLPAATVYSAGDHAFEALCKREDIDLICIATPWNWHVPMAVYAMTHGKHVVVEVPAANTIQECWDLVNTSEKTGRHCIQLENCCYGYNEMLINNLVHDGVLGELTHGGAAYDHDLRSILFSAEGEGMWRRAEHWKRNGNLYPTHGLGPVAKYMDINRGDRFEYMVSMSSPALSLAHYRDSTTPADDPRRKETYKCGDQNTSLIKTAKGRIITLEHNVSSPEPYDRINMIAGTKGIFKDYPARIFVDGTGKDEWGPIDPYKAKYEHPFWTKQGELARKLGGHGGMDFIMVYRLIQCVQQGLVPDMDVYDAASWSAPAPLSEASVAHGSAPQQFPDFTRGHWSKRDA
ncbi:MAG: Gfo/Idh/MocA family oxidoreductase [Acidobacteria bacterium]|nr:Gfo/Idh/MocA family oxidoreductase [Acidobacteriota bacterium]